MLICITNQKLCQDDFLDRINEIVKGKPYGIMLREKDLKMEEYEMLAVNIKEICDRHQVNLIINQNIEIAEKLKVEMIQLSMEKLRNRAKEIKMFKQVGASIHSVNEAKEAESLGATYLIAGHIFRTDCKKGVPPRGLPFLKEVCDAVKLPVFAIGGISEDNFERALSTGAKGVCVMSEAMTCLNPLKLGEQYHKDIINRS